MATDQDPPEAEQDEHEAEARIRREAGIEQLSEGEELFDPELFSRLHTWLATGDDPGEAAEDVPEGFEDSAEVELLLEEVVTELPLAQTVPDLSQRAVMRPPQDSAEVAALERELLRAKSRDEVAALALRIARYHARVAALFVVNCELIAGLRGAGEGVDMRLEGIMIPTGAQSVFAEAVANAKLARTQQPMGHIDQRLLRAMGRAYVEDILVLPVLIGRRVVNLLYVDNGADPLAATSIGALHVLCKGIARAYERVILERKRSAAAERR